MDFETLTRSLRTEIKKRENEQYFTCQTNIRDMCKDCLNMVEDQDKEIKELKKQNEQMLSCFKALLMHNSIANEHEKNATLRLVKEIKPDIL